MKALEDPKNGGPFEVTITGEEFQAISLMGGVTEALRDYYSWDGMRCEVHDDGHLQIENATCGCADFGMQKHRAKKRIKSAYQAFHLLMRVCPEQGFLKRQIGISGPRLLYPSAVLQERDNLLEQVEAFRQRCDQLESLLDANALSLDAIEAKEAAIDSLRAELAHEREEHQKTINLAKEISDHNVVLTNECERLDAITDPRLVDAVRVACSHYRCRIEILSPDADGYRIGFGVPGSPGYQIGRLCEVEGCKGMCFYGWFRCDDHRECKACGATQKVVSNVGHRPGCAYISPYIDCSPAPTPVDKTGDNDNHEGGKTEA